MSSRRLAPAQSAAIASDELRLGHITGVFGLSGEVRLFLYNPQTDLFEGKGAEVILVDAAGDRSPTWLRSRPGAGKRILGQVRGVDTPETARGVVGCEIVLSQAQLPKPKDDEFYHHQLIGLSVQSETGEIVGRISAIHEGPDTDIWIVDGPEGQSMIPAVRELVISVDLEDGVTVVDGAGKVL